MKSFKYYYVEKILKENKIQLLSKDIKLLSEGQFLNKVRNIGLSAALAASGAGLNQAQSAEPIRSNIKTSIPSQHNQNSLNNFWRTTGDSYSPIKSNGIKINAQTFISKDELKDHKIDFSYTSVDPSKFKTGKSDGVGLNNEEAITDALSNIGRYYIGASVGSNQTVKNDELTQDDLETKSNVVIGNFKVTSIKNEKGLIRVKIIAEYQSSNNSQQVGVQTFRNLNKDGKYNIFKKTIK
jgi:hypothetical protein